MDRAQSSHSRLSPSSVSSYETAILQRRSSSHTLPQETPSRQRRLLENRNARFAAKKISLSDLSSRFTQLIHANDHTIDDGMILMDQENMSPSEKKLNGSKPAIRSRRSLGVLEETTNTGRPSTLRKRSSIPIHLDDPERPLLERSPVSSPGYQHMPSSETNSPMDLNPIQDGLDSAFTCNALRLENMHSPRIVSPSAIPSRALRARRSAHFSSTDGTQQYIEHIEQQLQQAKQDNYSPTSNKSLKDQLQRMRLENKQLHQDMSNLRDTMEAELKSSVEHRMSAEAELKSKVKVLQEDLDRRDLIIQELKYQHEDKRLENNAVESLKATIDRLQQDLQAMEDENRSMSKRNEVLSELLAMSPTKAQASFELRSPVRERRTGRPMSMIIPRLPSSPPLKPNSQPASAIMSPSISTSSYFNLPHLDEQILEKLATASTQSVTELQAVASNLAVSIPETEDDNLSRVSDARSHQSSSPVAMSQVSPPSPIGLGVARLPPKRKPRKFMSGSTQLKPLLLPALTSENVALLSPTGRKSPKTGELREFSQESFDPTSFFLSQPLDAQSVAEAQSNFSGGPGPEAVFSDDDLLMSPTHAQPAAERHESHLMGGEQPVARGMLQVDRELDSIRPNADPDLFYEPIRERAISWGEVCRVIESQSGSHKDLTDLDLELDESTYCRERSETPSDDIDVTALNRIHLPEASYDPYPAQDASAGENPNVDIPQPLFSPSTRTNPSRKIAVHQTNLDLPQFGLSPPLTGAHVLHNSQHEVVETATSSQILEPVKKDLSMNICIESAPPIVPSRPISSSSGSRNLNRSASSSASSLMRSRSPLDLLQARQFGAKPLAVLTIRTIYGTISRCTSYIRDLKRDPLALARRVLANAWFANWGRLGRLAWWVLGIFIPFTNVRKRLSWNLDSYDGEAIAQQICGSKDGEPETRHSAEAGSAVHDIDPNSPVDGYQDGSQPAGGLSETPGQKPGWGKSVLLWGKFSLAIALAVGGAIVKGPGEMMKDIDGKPTLKTEHVSHETPHGRSHEPSTLIYGSAADEAAACRGNPSESGEDQQYSRTHHRSRTEHETESNATKTGHRTRRSETHAGIVQGRIDYSTIRPFRDKKTHIRQLFEADNVDGFEQSHGLLSRDVIYPDDSVSIRGD